jgi:glycerol-3-phosphate dehydrogenase|tara:strand:+ start:454 stop:1689 length:1236 start_codon:yes stop_codon:yes gene_type:complete
MSQVTVKLDIAIIGGGIAGLWLLNRLSAKTAGAGFNCHLFESKALGSDQSVGSQGMIHGGMKYSLSGALSGASEAIADMPAHWRACLEGKGDVDLSRARTLSDHFYMWSSGSVSSKLTTFFASKATRGRVDKVSKKDRPAVFQNKQFSGNLYKLVDIVLDVPSVVTALVDNCSGQTHLIDWSQSRLQKNDDGSAYILIDQGDKTIRVEAQRFIFAAGKGNAELLQNLGLNGPTMQIRPLQQVMVKLDYPHPFYGHCLGADKTPRLTISSHPFVDAEGKQSWVWYLGGSLSEKGAQQSAAEVIACAQEELTELMPWLDLSTAEWAALPIERAEPQQKNLLRPDKAFSGNTADCSNVLVTWPTKLTLAPNLANEVLDNLERDGIKPSIETDSRALRHLATPEIAKTPWQKAFQ